MELWLQNLGWPAKSQAAKDPLTDGKGTDRKHAHADKRRCEGLAWRGRRSGHFAGVVGVFRAKAFVEQPGRQYKASEARQFGGGLGGRTPTTW